MSLRQSLKVFCKNADMYANPINLTFNNSKVYKTWYGGLLTVISFMIIVIWLMSTLFLVYDNNYDMQER